MEIKSPEEECTNSIEVAEKLHSECEFGHTTDARLLPSCESSVDKPTVRSSKPSDDLVADSQTDRFTCLPEDLKRNILSFLSTKDAVKTCILSKDWRNLFRSCTAMDLQLNELKCVPQYVLDRFKQPFPPLQTVHLSPMRVLHKSFYVECLNNIIANHPTLEHLKLKTDAVLFWWGIEIEIPKMLFEMSQMRSLSLEGFRLPDIDTCSTASLQRLELCGVSFSGHTLSMLLESCLSLKKLVIDCFCSSDVHIVSTSLEVLVVRGLVLNADVRVEISTPSLLSLTLAEDEMDHTISTPLNELVEAEIGLIVSGSGTDVQMQCLNLLERLSGVRILTILGPQVFQVAGRIPRFLNLENLISVWTLKELSELKWENSMN